MSAIIKISCPSMTISFDGYYFKYHIKGIKEGYRSYIVSDFDQMPSQVKEYILGRKVRGVLHRACAARGWESPLKSYDEVKERQQKEAAKAAAAKLYYDDLAQKRQQLKERAEIFLQVPSQTNWEILHNGKTTTTFLAVLATRLEEPKSYSNRSVLIAAMHTAQQWGALYDRLMQLPISEQVGRTDRAYYEDLYYQNGGYNFPKWVWDWKQYVIQATARLQELESFDFE